MENLNNSICFITCVNDESLYAECLQYIQKLVIPNGLILDTLPIRGAKSMTSAYNYAMKKSNAKYKVYLHQDVFIINRNFIVDILNLFETNPEVGLIGITGSKKIPYNGIWWTSSQNYGVVYEDYTKILSFKQPKNEFEFVQCLDGSIIISQYDVPWNEGIFDGWHFYDISQCMEFIRHKYKIIIPKQNTPWCIHYCGEVDVTNYNKYRYKFLKEYGNELFVCGYLPIVIVNKIKEKTRPFFKKIEISFKKTFKIRRKRCEQKEG